MQDTQSYTSPFVFILQQLEAAEQERLAASIEPPKRPRGRPPKVEESPLLPNAYRHVLKDEDSEFDKQYVLLSKADKVDAPSATISAPIVVTDGCLAIVMPAADGKFACVLNEKLIGTSKHQDYWEYHYARGDLRNAADFKIGKFVRVSSTGAVDAVYAAAKGRKCTVLPPTVLSPTDHAEIAAALEVSYG